MPKTFKSDEREKAYNLSLINSNRFNYLIREIVKAEDIKDIERAENLKIELAEVIYIKRREIERETDIMIKCIINKYTQKNICPKCNKNELHEDEEMNSLSRDNETIICNDCGTREAFADM